MEGPSARPQYDAMVFFGTFMYADTAGRFKPQEPPNELRHNIFAYANPATDLYRVGQWRNDAEWDRRQAVFEDNLIDRRRRAPRCQLCLGFPRGCPGLPVGRF